MATADGNRPHSGRTRSYETHHDADGDASLGETIIGAVAAAEGVDPTDADLQLYDAVDLEALDALYDRRSPDGHWQFEFTIDGLLVTVAGDGRVTVWERE